MAQRRASLSSDSSGPEHHVELSRKRLLWPLAWVSCVMVAWAALVAAASQPVLAQQAPSQAGMSHAAVASQQPAAASSDQTSEALHIVVGHSLLIRTPSRVRRILTGNPAVIESVLTSPQELVVTAKQPGGSSLMLWQENGQNRMLDVFADLDVSPLRNTLDQSFPNSGVEVQTEGDKVMLVGVVPSAATVDQMLKMAGNFSKEVVNGLQVALPPRPKQVMLKVRFAEADRARLSAFG